MEAKRQPKEGIYRVVSVRMWGDAKFCSLTPLPSSGQSLWLYLLTGPHTSQIPGVFVMGKAAMAEALEWSPESFDKPFDELIAKGMVEFDAKSRMWFIPNAIHHNPPPNPNVVLSWRSTWPLLPECGFRERIETYLSEVLAAMGDTWVEAFKVVCGKGSAKGIGKGSANHSPNRMAKQEQEQEQDKEPSASSLAATPTPTIPCPYSKIVELYHSLLPELPRVKLMAEARQKVMRKRWAWVISSTKSDGARRATNADEALQWFRGYFDLTSKNDWLMGRSGRSQEHANWQADLDYLLTDRAMTHVIEKTKVAA